MRGGGRCISTFPIGSTGSGRTATTEDRRRHVRNLIEAVLFTAPGERVNRPEFGSGVRDLLFDVNSDAMVNAAEFMIRSAVQRYLSELVVVDSLAVERDEGELRITLAYTLRADEERVTETFVREV